MKIEEISKAEAEALCDFIETGILEAIKNDDGIDNITWLVNIVNAFKKLAEYCEYNGLTYTAESAKK